MQFAMGNILRSLLLAGLPIGSRFACCFTRRLAHEFAGWLQRPVCSALGWAWLVDALCIPKAAFCCKGPCGVG